MKFGIALALFAVAVCGCTRESSTELDEYSVAELQSAMQQGQLSARDVVEHYLAEIERIDRGGPELRSIIEINPDALQIAIDLDRERASSGPRGPLHGVPVVLKANIDTGDSMQTTAGSLALAGHRAADDAFLVAALRQSGAIILAKTNLSEWANFRSTRSSSGWSSIGGQTKNPYDPARNPCGSSSGSAVAVAANLTLLAVGTETDGSVVCPAGINGIVGIKPTLGLVSRDGIIPIAHSQDTAGPMARTVTDAAILLRAMSAFDAADSASAARPENTPDYAAELSPDALKGRRIGVLRNYYGAGEDPNIEAVFEQTIETLKAAGAEIVDPVRLNVEGMSAAEGAVLNYEFKADLNAYLGDSRAGLSSLEEIIQFNEANANSVMPFFGQEQMLVAQAKGPLTDEAYLQALAESKRVSQDAINSVLTEQSIDAIVAPTNAPAWMTDHVNGDSFGLSSSSYAAVSGYPSITVPAGFVHGLPVGVSFFAGAFSEKRLIDIAYAFEQASMVRKAPADL